jgi:16S rRNA (guanine966-N2)-methyltransferase
VTRVRLSGGRFGGLWLEVPAGIRPTAGRVREALLSIWQPALPGARFLELFAGSGAVGLEALGRGAKSVILVDSDPKVVKELRRNLPRVAPRQPWRVLRLDLPRGLSSPAVTDLGPFDLIFADPPYRFAAYAELVAAAAGVLAPGGQLAVEHSSRAEWPDPDVASLGRRRRSRYGETSLTFYQAG